MKTATVRTLRNDYAKLLRQVEAGAEVAISRRGRVVARLVPALGSKAGVDWATSAAHRVTRSDQPLSATQSAKLIREAQGNW
ncbi:MAG: type II toxin-antitoxin system prevent-host-death family antitoxin [Opitutaceae bacterium]|nr:type II toxin-antitoxin system prevent-host-death family antitoxin [Opitutaceae bacterium]MBP9913818.1 type II toxin-antitoxin system prevent-host-death family antitoxin [Opitutaceae bacterium]